MNFFEAPKWYNILNIYPCRLVDHIQLRIFLHRSKFFDIAKWIKNENYDVCCRQGPQNNHC